ncbi:hypothetical protein FGG08_007469, partial [Glutinoglossum americanum]
MFDLAINPGSMQIIKEFYESDKVVSAVCHGPAALINVVLPDGSYLPENSPDTGFSNAEEEQVGITKAVPFLLEDELNKRSGGKHEKAAGSWRPKVASAEGGRLLTGENSASATPLAEAVLQAIKKAPQSTVRNRAGLCERAQAGAHCFQQTTLHDGTPPLSELCNQCQSPSISDSGVYGPNHTLEDSGFLSGEAFGELLGGYLDSPAAEYSAVAVPGEIQTGNDAHDTVMQSIDGHLQLQGDGPLDLNWNFGVAGDAQVGSNAEGPPQTVAPTMLSSRGGSTASAIQTGNNQLFSQPADSNAKANEASIPSPAPTPPPPPASSLPGPT